MRVVMWDAETQGENGKRKDEDGKRKAGSKEGKRTVVGKEASVC